MSSRGEPVTAAREIPRQSLQSLASFDIRGTLSRQRRHSYSGDELHEVNCAYQVLRPTKVVLALVELNLRPKSKGKQFVPFSSPLMAYALKV
jgi:hypothetical protein